MRAELNPPIAFHGAGKRPNEELGVADLSPAAFTAYRDLDALRYDFPLVLTNDEGPAAVKSLSGMIDGVVNRITVGGDSERLRRHAFRLEREVRRLVAEGGGGASLARLVEAAVDRLETHSDDLLADSLKRLKAGLTVDGEVVGCDASTPLIVVRHLWTAANEIKAKAFRAEIEPLTARLADILAADFAHSEEGQSAEKLSISVGASQREAFDFSVMSRLLAQTSGKGALPESRRRRIRSLLKTLKSQRFYPLEGDVEPYGFYFDNIVDALTAYRERQPMMIEVAKAIAIAKFEVDSAYREALHDAFFADFGGDGLDASDSERFPDSLVFAHGGTCETVGGELILRALSVGLSMKALVQIDDLIDPSPLGDATLTFGLRGQQLVNAAIGCGAVAVAQTTSSNLYAFREKLYAVMAYAGPSLLNIYSGAPGDATGLPPYLAAAAAFESRAFPALSYNPAAGPELASRFSLEGNPQLERDWPTLPFTYEDGAHQSLSEDLAFTLVDFAACDRRLARRFVNVLPPRWTDDMVPVASFIAAAPEESFAKSPSLMMVDRSNRLRKAIVDGKLIAEARRCLQAWRGLQELGGVNNSHAARALARQRETLQAPAAPQAPAPTAASAAADAPIDAAPERSLDEPYIETARCTSCNECKLINDKMFGYDANKQASIVDPDAGTYRELVEAAENCQISIIHPGKPRNPDEPGLEELISRAQAFL